MIIHGMAETVKEDVMDVILLVDAREVSAVGEGEPQELLVSSRKATRKKNLNRRNEVGQLRKNRIIDL